MPGLTPCCQFIESQSARSGLYVLQHAAAALHKVVAKIVPPGQRIRVYLGEHDELIQEVVEPSPATAGTDEQPTALDQLGDAQAAVTPVPAVACDAPQHQLLDAGTEANSRLGWSGPPDCRSVTAVPAGPSEYLPGGVPPLSSYGNITLTAAGTALAAFTAARQGRLAHAEPARGSSWNAAAGVPVGLVPYSMGAS